MMTIGARVADHARVNPTAIFCRFLSDGSVQTITFADLFAAACAYACAYRSRGVAPGDVVIIILRHSPHLYYSFVGALLVGAIPSFMPFPSPKQRSDRYWHDHAQLFERIEPRLIVTYDENLAAARAAIPGFAIETLIATDALLAPDAVLPAADVAGDPSAIACLQHTSGTTGLKKGIMLSHAAIVDHVAQYSRAIRLTPDDRIVSWLPLYHDMGFIACFMLALIEGVELIALDPFEWVMRPQLLLEAIERHRATLCWLPNFAFSHLVNAVRRAAAFDLRSMRAFINCSEPCKARTFERFAQRFAVGGDRLHICYALAENVFAATQTNLGAAVRTLDVDVHDFSRGRITPVRSGGQRLMSCGPPIGGVRVAVRGSNAAEAEAPAGEIGEIYLSSNNAFAGYYREPELTARKRVGGWFATGDLGFFHAGELYVTGRVDDMLIVNGRNVYAHEIEALVDETEGVIPGRNVALGIDDERADATAIVVLAECREPQPDRERITQQIRLRLLEGLGLTVHSVTLLEPGRLLKTTSGKLSRRKNKEAYVGVQPG